MLALLIKIQYVEFVSKIPSIIADSGLHYMYISIYLIQTMY